MYRLAKSWYQRHFSQPGTVEFALVLIAIFVVVYYFMWLVGPLVVALCLAYCLDWAVRWLENGHLRLPVPARPAGLKRAFEALNVKLGRINIRFSRTCASSLVVTVVIVAMIAIVVLLLPQIIRQGNALYSNLQAYAQDAAVQESEAVEQGFELSTEDIDQSLSRRIYEWVEMLPEPLPNMVSRDFVTESVTKGRQQLLGYLTQFMREQLMPGVVNVISWLAYPFIVLVFTFLMLVDKVSLQRRMRRYLLPSNTEIIRVFWPKINLMLENYIIGKIMHIAIMSVINMLVLELVGLNYSVILGVGAGLSVVIPIVGAILIGVPVVLVAVLQFGISLNLVLVLGAFLIVQLIDAYGITPKIFSSVLKIDNFSILAAIFIFGGLWGFWGVFFSIPLATFIKTIIVSWPAAPAQGEQLPVSVGTAGAAVAVPPGDNAGGETTGSEAAPRDLPPGD